MTYKQMLCSTSLLLLLGACGGETKTETTTGMDMNVDMATDMNMPVDMVQKEEDMASDEPAAFFKAFLDDRVSKIYCKAGFQCPGTFGQSSTAFDRYADEEDCVRNIIRVHNRPDPEMIAISLLEVNRETFYASLDDGRTTFNKVKVKECLDALDVLLAKPACEMGFLERTFDKQLLECLRAFEGTVEEDGACTLNEDCKDYDPQDFLAMQCSDISRRTCGGVCFAVPDMSFECLDPCLATEWCDLNDGTCRTRVDLGEACTKHSECGAEKYCDTEHSGDRVCATYYSKAEGTSCLHYIHCRKGLTCDWRDATDLGTCRKPQDLVFGALGEDCTLKNGCLPGLICNQGTCAKAGEEGVACTTHKECADELECISGKCLPPLANGEACESELDCASYSCEEQKCTDAKLCTLP